MLTLCFWGEENDVGVVGHAVCSDCRACVLWRAERQLIPAFCG